jgi:hypothetical protein
MRGLAWRPDISQSAAKHQRGKTPARQNTCAAKHHGEVEKR